MSTLQHTIDRLIQPLAAGHDPMPFHGLHGFFSAQAICPATLSDDDLIESMLDGKADLSPADKSSLLNAFNQLEDSIDRGFNSEDGFMLSCETEDAEIDEDNLADWCAGFMEAHFLDEAAWFNTHEQEVCELLLPIMLASGLFDDEPEFREMKNDEKLTEEMFSQIPQVLMELYLMFNSPEDIRKQ